jgi:PAS domain S-box-containing protein
VTIASTLADAAVLSGGGEMGALMRAKDWSATPLGPVEDWPQSLRTAVSILLDSRFGMYIAWGPRYAQIYNDGYRPILGSTKHPQALGNLASTTFAESWDIIGPMFDDVMRGNATGSDDRMLPLDRHGYLEECFFTFSYSPIRIEHGVVGGVHVTVTETTKSVLAARRLRVLHTLSESSSGKRTAEEACRASAASLGASAHEDVPFALFYLLSPDRTTATLAGTFGIEEGTRGAPRSLEVAASGTRGGPEETSWPLHRALDESIVVFGDVDAVAGNVVGRAWPEPVGTAALVPITRRREDAPFGVIVAGISPRRALDADYEDFLARVGSHVASAIADARALDDERRLVEAERARLYTHFLQAPFPIAVLRGSDFVVELANPAALAIWGKTPALVGQRLLDGFPELGGQPFVGYLEQVLRTGVAHEGRGALARLPRGPDGALTDVYLNFVYAPLRNVDGVVEGVLVAGFEVTAEVLARRDVEEAQRLFKSVVDNVPELAWTARPDGYIDFYNQRWYDYTGTTPAQMEGWGWKAVHDPAKVDEVVESWQRTLALGEPFEMEFRIRGADGTFRWFLTRVRPLLDADGQIVRWFGTNTNIDERVRLLASEKAAREEAERSNRAKDEFLAIVSHELRNPLNAMLGWTRLLRAGSLPPDRQERALETIERNAVTQAQLIEDLLDVARVVSGKLPLAVESVRFARVVEAALDSARPAIEAKGLRLEVVLDTDGLLSGDPARLQQVVWNLITNATKFTPRGGRIRVTLLREPSHLVLSVDDDGQGIDPSFLPFVFDRFKQADASTTKVHGGLGLGLAIAKNLVEMHGGTIAVHSDGAGKGASFTVRLPVAAVRREASAASPPPRARTPAVRMDFDAPADMRGIRVLAVDDDADCRDIVAAVLGSCGMLVVTAASAADAMQHIEREAPDVLLSDIGMPDEDGYSLIRRIRELPRGRGGMMPAACLTGYVSADDRRRSLLAGFSMHVPKPIDPAELVAVVASLARMATALRSTAGSR